MIKRRNLLAKELGEKKFSPKIVPPKKGKGSKYTRKKKDKKDGH